MVQGVRMRLKPGPMATPRVLVLFDGSSRSKLAVGEATRLARESGTRLSVLVVAAVEEASKCCNCETTFWNQDMRRLAQEQAVEVRALLSDDVPTDVIVREGKGKQAVARTAAGLGCATVVEARRRGARPRAVAV